MANQRIIGGASLPSSPLGAVPAAIAGLTVLAYFGSAGDGINSNRVAGGPTLTPSAQAPVVHANYVTTGGTSGTNTCYALTGLVRSSAVLSSGWTVMAVARLPTSGNPSLLWLDQGSPGSYLNAQNNVTGGPNTGNSVVSATAPTSVSQPIVLGSAGAAAAFRAYGFSYSGGGTGGTFTVADVSGNQSIDVPGTSGVNTNNFNWQIGYNTNGNASFFGAADIAFFMVALSPLNLAAQRAIYTSIKGLLARRGISVA